MKKTASLLCFTLVVISVSAQPDNLSGFELIRPGKEAVATLILFGGFPETPVDIEREFRIRPIAGEYGVNLLLMKVNQRILLEDSEIMILANTIEKAVAEHQLIKENIVIGGYSSGGNLAMLVANQMMISKNISIKPKGIFVVDSPLDLVWLYEASVRVSKQTVDEEYARNYGYQVQLLEQLIGKPSEVRSKYEHFSPFNYQTKIMKNVEGLKEVELRLYTEPAPEWATEHGLHEQDMNAFILQRFYELMKAELPSSSIELIITENKGYDSGGKRNPHHWSVVEKQELMEWIVSF
ncbi:MAG TPA: hypothetical protein DEQ34_06795 [Balneolaceae bacterium]|nr:hypothetical protein [Balneolaceae bacterium]|tara:strand:+ start:17707 stop:18591 length:885 start_codon:yes stop_codon:yes gene_type:complete